MLDMWRATFAEAIGTAAQNKQSGVRCTYWIDKHHTPCGGTHSWEDHKAALQKFAPPKGKGNSSDKGKGKGKCKDQAHSLTECPKEDQTGEDGECAKTVINVQVDNTDQVTIDAGK